MSYFDDDDRDEDDGAFGDEMTITISAEAFFKMQDRLKALEATPDEIEPMWTPPIPGQFIAGLWRVTRTPLAGSPDTLVTSYEQVSEDTEALTTANARIKELEAALTPFANAWTGWLNLHGWVLWPDYIKKAINGEDFERAAEALAGK